MLREHVNMLRGHVNMLQGHINPMYPVYVQIEHTWLKNLPGGRNICLKAQKFIDFS